MRSKQLTLARYDTDKIHNGFLAWYDTRFQHLVESEVKVLEIGVHNGGSLLLWRDYFPKGTIVGVDLQRPAGWVDQERIKFFLGSQNDTSFLSDVARQTAPDGFDLIIDDASHIGALTKVCFWRLFEHHLKPSGMYVIEDWITGYWDEWPDGRGFQQATGCGPGPVKSLVRRVFHKLPRGLRERVKSLKSLQWLRRPFQKPPPFGKTPFASHMYGMVGFVKELIDEQGAGALTQGGIRLVGRAPRLSKFERMEITPQLVFITKKGASEIGTQERADAA